MLPLNVCSFSFIQFHKLNWVLIMHVAIYIYYFIHIPITQLQWLQMHSMFCFTYIPSHFYSALDYFEQIPNIIILSSDISVCIVKL